MRGGTLFEGASVTIIEGSSPDGIRLSLRGGSALATSRGIGYATAGADRSLNSQAALRA